VAQDHRVGLLGADAQEVGEGLELAPAGGFEDLAEEPSRVPKW
jgi:hypothetical protein